MALSPHAVRIFGDPVLKRSCSQVTEIDDALVELVDDMIETMYAANGVGLAANQVGVQKRLFVYDAGDGPFAVLNPVITSTTGEFRFDEGCLAVPKMYFPIVRPDRVHLTGMDLQGKPLDIDADGYLGRILQHEVDHLDGKLLLDRLDAEARKAALREWRERQMAS